MNELKNDVFNDIKSVNFYKDTDSLGKCSIQEEGDGLTVTASITNPAAKAILNRIYGINSMPIDGRYSGLFALPKIKKVIFNPPATIIIWDHDELIPPCKTVVKCSENDIYSKEVGFAMAVMKKLFGNDNTFYKLMKKYVK